MNERESFLDRIVQYIDSDVLLDVIRLDLGLPRWSKPPRLNVRDLLDVTLAELDARPRPPPDFPHGFAQMLRAVQVYYPLAPAWIEFAPADDRTLREQLLARWPEAQEALAVVRTVLPLESLRTASALSLWYDAIGEAHKRGLRDALVKLVAAETPDA